MANATDRNVNAYYPVQLKLNSSSSLYSTR